MPAAPSTASKLAHMVYFTLKDRSPEARARLLEACQKYLTGHPGVDYFSLGIRVPDLTREVNDQEFDVALNVIFASRQAHDTYQSSERHVAFITENKPTWAKVRVYDSYVEG